jgi:hypothetical protein
MSWMFLYLLFTFFVGLFAHIRRNRNGFAWAALCLLISPLIAGIIVAILQPLPSKSKRDGAADTVAVAFVAIVGLVLFFFIKM